MSEAKQCAPTLYAIIFIKLLKGLLFLSVALLAYALSDNDLPIEYKQLLHWLRFNPERKFFSDLAVQVGKLTEKSDIRYGLVAYRDRGDDYVTRVYDFTPDVAAFQANLNTVEAGGGGDIPESLNEALHTT